MLMKWSDLEPGDIIKFTYEFAESILTNNYRDYVEDELKQIREFRNEELRVLKIDKKIVKDEERYTITLSHFYFPIVINEKGFDVGYGKGCPEQVFEIRELRGE